MKIIATVEHYIDGEKIEPVTIKLSEDDLKEMIEDRVYNDDSNNDIHNSYAKTKVITFLDSSNDLETCAHCGNQHEYLNLVDDENGMEQEVCNSCVSNIQSP